MKRFKLFILSILSRYFHVFKLIYDLRGECTAPLSDWLFYWFKHKYVKKYKMIYWPVSSNSRISGSQFMFLGVGVAPGVMNGCYITANEDNPLDIGDY